jgi:DNA helicase-2/ATP-dependent DNA helicase PcrA
MAKIYFAANRQLYGSWQSSLPSRFVDELPIQHVDVESEANQYNPSLITSRVQEDFSRSFTNAQNAGRTSPGWERYKNNKDKSYGRAPKDIEGHAVRRPAKGNSSNYMVGERVFHNKFGYGAVKATEGTKLTVEFEKAGEKMVLDGFVQRASEV